MTSESKANFISPLFTNPNQAKWFHHYWRLCSRAITRMLPENIYVEQHHVIPRCIQKNTNIIVCLTPEEHYVAHQLLVKIYPGNHRLVYAANMMTASRFNNNKSYGWIRRKVSEARKGVPKSDEHKRKLSEFNLGKKLSIETRHKMSVSRTGFNHSEETKATLSEIRKGEKHRPWSEEEKRNMSISRRGRKGHPCSEEKRKRISQSRQGRPGHAQTQETRRKISKVRKGKKRVVDPITRRQTYE